MVSPRVCLYSSLSLVVQKKHSLTVQPKKKKSNENLQADKTKKNREKQQTLLLLYCARDTRERSLFLKRKRCHLEKRKKKTKKENNSYNNQ